MSQNVSHKEAAEALDSLDDYARMTLGIDAFGPRGMLERYIAQQAATLRQPAARVDEGMVHRAWSVFCEVKERDEATGVNPDKRIDNAMRAALEAALSAQPAPHPDDAAVDAFAAAMKAKLAGARAKGRGGWQSKDECSQQQLSDMLRAHVEKGDPRDVANFCMFLHQRGEAIQPAPELQGEAVRAWPKFVQDECLQVLRNMDTELGATGRKSARIERLINAIAGMPAAPVGVPDGDCPERKWFVVTGANRAETPILLFTSREMAEQYCSLHPHADGYSIYSAAPSAPQGTQQGECE